MTKDNQQYVSVPVYDELLNISQVATKLRVTDSWVKAAVFNNLLPYYKIGRLVRFKTSQIDSWIELNKKEVQS